MPLLEVRGLRLAFGSVEVLRGIDFHVEEGETLGVVGESGCGKSLTGLSLMGLLPPEAKITEGRASFQGTDLLNLSAHQMSEVRGGDIAMVFQDPFTSLNPSMRVGDQIAEVFVLHRGKSWSEARQLAVQQIAAVQIPSPESATRKFPHELSGGQRQRIMIAMAFACHPKVLIADEPTTALDVTLQAQILALLAELQAKERTAVVLISHDIGVIASVSDRIAVFYAGKVVEEGLSEEVLLNPKHPYTQGLLASLPGKEERLKAIPGQPPAFATLGQECSFAPRCAHRFEKCDRTPPLLGEETHRAACWLLENNHE